MAGETAYFSLMTSTLPNFSSAGPIFWASPTTMIAESSGAIYFRAAD